MNWLNIETATLDAEEFVGSEPTARATWLCLLRYCCGQENGGVIAGCKSWPDRKWQQLARVTKAEAETESALWSWEGENLRLWRYPTEKETEVQHKRERARTNGKLGGRPTSKPTSETEAEPTLVNSAKAERNGRRRERKENGIGMEGSAEGSAPTDAEWLASLASDPAFAGLDVQREFAKMSAWCAVNRKAPSRRRFINWLNRAERPMAPAGAVTQDTFGSVRPGREAW